jgi:hypothetical protein
MLGSDERQSACDEEAEQHESCFGHVL